MISAKEAYQKSIGRLCDERALEKVCNIIDNNIYYGRFMCECNIGAEFFPHIKRELERNGYKVRIIKRYKKRYKKSYDVNISWAGVKL